MSTSIRQWLFGTPLPAAWAPLQAWCSARGLQLKPTAERDGFVIEIRHDALHIRIEWGPSQRHYLGSQELRLRAETGMPPEVYALVLPRGLLTRLEAELYSQFTVGTETRLDAHTPEEMRWLAMSQPLDRAHMGPLRPVFSALSNAEEWLSNWLAGATGKALLAWNDAATATPDFALIGLRGRMAWRQA
ncbi:hypothetical protein, partial [Ideonella sp.]|uniref:hypothetical protein n=1 Tax=Ideonella sp. TaxID=1929293 RepID=UPI003BB515D1